MQIIQLDKRTSNPHCIPSAIYCTWPGRLLLGWRLTSTSDLVKKIKLRIQLTLCCPSNAIEVRLRRLALQLLQADLHVSPVICWFKVGHKDRVACSVCLLEAIAQDMQSVD